MENGILAKNSPLSLLLFTTALVGAGAVSRYISQKNSCSAKTLADGLLDTGPLRQLTNLESEPPENLLAACAIYMLRVSFWSARNGLSGGCEDPAGYNRVAKHPYTQDKVTVLTEENRPDSILTYAVKIRDMGVVRGTRKVSPIHFGGVMPVREMPDSMQINLGSNYSVQIEALLEAQESYFSSQAKPMGTVVLHDNMGCVARLRIASDGSLSGTITKSGRVVARMHGNGPSSFQFTTHQDAPPQNDENSKDEE